MDIQSLSVPERILLTKKLWDSVRVKPDKIELSTEQIALLESRLQALEADGESGGSWANVKSKITKS